jgi:hypothetical protein
MKKKWRVTAYPYDISQESFKRSGFDSVKEAVEYFDIYYNDDNWIEISYTSYEDKDEVNVEDNT